MEALEPFRTQWNRAASDPQPMPYLSSDANRAKGAFDVRMQVLLTTEKSRAESRRRRRCRPATSATPTGTWRS